MRHTLTILSVLILTVALSHLAIAGDYLVLTNELPPIKFEKNGTVQGVAGDVLAAIMASAGESLSPDAIHIVPWNEAYERTLNTPNTICLAMAKTPSREAQFKWVGPIYTTRIGLIGKKKTAFAVQNIEDTARLRIGTVVDSAPEKAILAQGISVESLVRRTTTEAIINLLDQGNVDLISFAQTPTFYAMLQQGINPDEYEMKYELGEVDLYIAFNKATDTQLINELQNAFEILKKPGADGSSEYDRMVQRYFRPNI